jgi:hypothetical protein
VASYPFIEEPKVLTDNKRQAISCMQSLEKRLKNQKTLQEFNDVPFQDTVKRGVFKEISHEEMEAWSSPVNYISMVETFKQGPQALTPISSQQFPSLHIKSQVGPRKKYRSETSWTARK